MKSRTLFAARSLQTKPPEISADNSLPNRPGRRSSRTSGEVKRIFSSSSLCRPLCLCGECDDINHRETENTEVAQRSSKGRSYDERRETHDEGDRGDCYCSDARC